MASIVPATDNALIEAADLLRRGGVIIAPTDTNYGIFVNPFNAQAVERVYAIKRRSRTSPLSLFIGTTQDWIRFAKPVNHPGLAALLDEFWPGPLNVILPRRSIIADHVTSGLDTVAIVHNRCSVLNLLYFYSGVPLGASSANISGTANDTLIDLEMANAQIGDQVDLIIEDQASISTRSSTIIDMTTPRPWLVRLGDIGPESIRHYLPDLETDMTEYKRILTDRQQKR